MMMDCCREEVDREGEGSMQVLKRGACQDNERREKRETDLGVGEAVKVERRIGVDKAWARQ